MSTKLVILFIVAICLMSCTSDSKTSCQFINNKIELWKYVVPSKTPYDYNQELSEIYKEAYTKGIQRALKSNGYPEMIDFFPGNIKEKAYADGFNHGRFLIHSVIQLYQTYEIERRKESHGFEEGSELDEPEDGQ